MTAPASPPPAQWDRERFRRNVDALGGRQPELAGRLADLDVPDTIEPARGRDGTATFRLRRPDGTRFWLGRTSTPTVSAPAVIEQFDPGGYNALVPTVGTGVELDLLCRRMPRHCAVFGYESDLVPVKLALHVADLAEHLRAGRLVLLAPEALEHSLPAFLEAHSGYEFPHRLLVHPAVPKEDFEGFRAASELAASATIAARQRAAGEAAAALKVRPATTGGDRPRVVLLSSGAGGRALADVDGWAAALKSLEWPTAVMAPSSPEQCHHLARLLLIREHRPDLVLLLDACTGGLTGFLPSDLPVASWFSPDSAPVAAAANGFGPEHCAFAATPVLAGQLRTSGFRPDRVHLLEVGADTTIFSPCDVDADLRGRLACDVAVFADAVDASARAVGIRQHTQIALWERIGKTLARRAHEYSPGTAPEIVAEAERAAGAKMGSDQVRERFVNLLRHRLAPTVVVRAAVRSLCRAGLGVRIWGTGWDGSRDEGTLSSVPLADARQRSAAYQCAGMVVFPIFESVQPILEVIAAGGRAVFRAPEGALEALHPQTAEVLERLPRFRGFGQMVACVRKSESSNHSEREALRSRVRSHHSLVQRCRSIRNTLCSTPLRRRQ